MGKEFLRATEEADGLVNVAIDKWHKHLARAGVKIKVVFVESDVPPAIKVHGAAALACVKKLNGWQRLLMDAEVLLQIDAAH